MSRLFLFGIGGTGSRVVRSMCMLMAANVDGFGPDTEVFPIIIDYDQTNGDLTRALDTIANYNKINRLANDREKIDLAGMNASARGKAYESFFCTPMSEMKDKVANGTSTYKLVYAPNDSEKLYSQTIGYNTLNGDNLITKMLLDSLYNTDLSQETTELHIETTVGFKGNPNVGSVMLDQLQQTAEYKDFLRLVTPQDRIVIVGSLFGGTGSSGIPTLVNAFGLSNNQNVKGAKKAIVLVCPYFKVAEPKGENRKEGVINSQLFFSKTKAALTYYRDTINSKVDAVYYVGSSEKMANYEHHIGKEAQKNPAHIVEFVAAMNSAHFMRQNIFDAVNKHWKYGLSSDLDDLLQAKVNDFKDADGAGVMLRLSAFAYMLKHLEDSLLKKADSTADNSYKFFSIEETSPKSTAVLDGEKNDLRELFKLILEFKNKFNGWMEELSKENQGVPLWSFDLAHDTGVEKTVRGNELVETEKNWIGREKKVSLVDATDLSAELASKVQGFLNAEKWSVKPLAYALLKTYYDAMNGNGIAANDAKEKEKPVVQLVKDKVINK